MSASPTEWHQLKFVRWFPGYQAICFLVNRFPAKVVELRLTMRGSITVPDESNTPLVCQKAGSELSVFGATVKSL